MNKNNRKKLKIMFVCYGNKCRSPMAEGVAKHENLYAILNKLDYRRRKR